MWAASMCGKKRILFVNILSMFQIRFNIMKYRNSKSQGILFYKFEYILDLPVIWEPMFQIKNV